MPAGSYVCGLSSMPLLGETIGVHFDRAASRWPDREALVVSHQDIRWSYTELQKRVDELAAGFIALGLEPGDRIGIWSPNNAEWVLTQFASAKAGLILVTVNPAYRIAELQHALRKSGCKALVLADADEVLDDRVGIARRLQRLAQNDIVEGVGGIVL